MVQINVKMEEATWRELRRVAEERRTSGRTSVAGVIMQCVREMLARREK